MTEATATEATKTVQGFFSPKQVTRDEYVREWSLHFAQLFHLANTTMEFDELKTMKARVAELAGAKWDNLKA